MKKLILASIALSLLSVPAMAQYDDTRAINAMRDAARAQERQADSMDRQRQIDYDRNLREDRAQRNFERDSRSSRRFDR